MKGTAATELHKAPILCRQISPSACTGRLLVCHATPKQGHGRPQGQTTASQESQVSAQAHASSARHATPPPPFCRTRIAWTAAEREEGTRLGWAKTEGEGTRWPRMERGRAGRGGGGRDTSKDPKGRRRAGRTAGRKVGGTNQRIRQKPLGVKEGEIE